MLWVGWFGFNGGSALAANGSAGMAILVTHISAATATLVWMTIDWFRNGKPGLVGIITGTIAITGECGGSKYSGNPLRDPNIFTITIAETPAVA